MYFPMEQKMTRTIAFCAALGWRIEISYYPVLPKGRPPGFVEARRRICPSPHLCLDPPGGTEEAICGPCDDAALRSLEHQK
jgi:hypothetical protein